MADLNEPNYSFYDDKGNSENPRETRRHWKTVCDTTGWRPSLQLTVHLRGDSKADARDRLMTLCAIYDSAELLRILPTVAEARLKLTPKAEPASLYERLDLDGTVIGAELKRLREDLDAAKEEGNEQVAKLSRRISDLAAFFDGWTSGMEQRCKDIEREQTAMQREIEELR